MTEIYISYAIALIGGLLAGLVTTPLVRSLARRINFVDKPDGGRKHQKTAVALGGGLAVYVAVLASIAATFAYARSQGIDLLNATANQVDRPVFIALFIGSACIVLLGLIDDKFGLRGRYKLLGQLGVAGLLVYSGLRIDQFGFFGQKVVIESDWLSTAITMVWLLVTINAINLIDGIDGLASSVGTVLCLTVATITGMLGYYAEAFIVLALAGAQLGFLRYNFAPASIYLGDTGSMLIGLVIGVIATHTSVKSPAAIAMVIPFALWSIPILDSSAAILRRKLTGRSLFAADRGHLHHSLLTRGWTVRQASLFITLICATTCLSAVLSMLWGMDVIALMIVAAVVLFLVSTKTFGHIEFELIKHRVRDSAASFSGSRGADDPGKSHSAIQLQGSRQWDKLWSAMVEAAGPNRLLKMKLAINIPALHEVYYGTWKSPENTDIDPETTWSIAHPLLVEGEKVGHLELLGQADSKHGYTPSQLMQVLDFLEPIEEDIRRIREQIEHNHEDDDTSQSLIRAAALPEQPLEKPVETPPEPAVVPAGQGDE